MASQPLQHGSHLTQGIASTCHSMPNFLSSHPAAGCVAGPAPCPAGGRKRRRQLLPSTQAASHHHCLCDPAPRCHPTDRAAPWPAPAGGRAAPPAGCRRLHGAPRHARVRRLPRPPAGQRVEWRVGRVDSGARQLELGGDQPRKKQCPPTSPEPRAPALQPPFLGCYVSSDMYALGTMLLWRHVTILCRP